MQKNGYVYIMTNKSAMLYIGVTSNLQRRVWEHKHDLFEGFTNKYQINKLIYFEIFDNINDAIFREKQLKRWHREWKLNLIKIKNPFFLDLYPSLID